VTNITPQVLPLLTSDRMATVTTRGWSVEAAALWRSLKLTVSLDLAQMTLIAQINIQGARF